MPRLLERLLIVVVSLAISIGVIAVLSGGLLAGRDNPGISGTTDGPGVAFADQGDARLRPGELQPVYDSDPPTSGAYVPTPITRDGAVVSDYQLLTVLAAGDVVFVYGTRTPPAGLRAVARSVTAAFTPKLAAGGGAVILARYARRIPAGDVVALAWTRMLRTSAGDVAGLRAFAQAYLGRGAPG